MGMHIYKFSYFSKTGANVATLIDNRIIQGLCGICNGKIHDDILPPALQSFTFFSHSSLILERNCISYYNVIYVSFLGMFLCMLI